MVASSRLRLAAYACGALLACNTGFVSLGWDDPAPREPLSCEDADCGDLPIPPAMCEGGSMGSYACKPSAADPLQCQWQPVCHVVDCSASECGEQPAGLMCSDGRTHEFECLYDAELDCAWQRPACAP